MKKISKEMWSLLYVTVTMVGLALLITYNYLTGMKIPLTASFLVGFVVGAVIYVAWHAVLTKGWKRFLWMFGLSFVIAFTAEALGVNFGLVFGPYHYTPALGIQPLGVPLLAALAWEPILYSSFSVVKIIIPKLPDPKTSMMKYVFALLGVAAMGAIATTAWDLMVDPVAVSQGYWVWHNGGPYVPYITSFVPIANYTKGGVPITNYLGWLLVAFIIQIIYRWIADRTTPLSKDPAVTAYGPIALYSSLFVSQFGVALTTLGHPEVALAGFMGMIPFIGSALSLALAHKNGSGQSG